jgi:hypothetical protein
VPARPFYVRPYSVFCNRDIIRFFEAPWIRLKEEDRGRMFPVSDKAAIAVSALIKLGKPSL